MSDNTYANEYLELLHSQPLSSLKDLKIEYLIPDLIVKGAITMMNGSPGCGKTTLVLTFCFVMAGDGCDILYLDRDNATIVAHERVSRFLWPSESHLLYHGLWIKDKDGNPKEAPEPDSLELIEAVRSLTNPVIVFDTLSTFLTGDENDSYSIGMLFRKFRFLTTLGCTVIILHHKGKNPLSTSRGSSAMESSADSVLVIDGEHVEGMLTGIKVSPVKTPFGRGKTINYNMVDGIPQRASISFYNRLFDILKANSGVSQDAFWKIIKKSFSRSSMRKFIEKGQACGKIEYKNRKLCAIVDSRTEFPSDDEDESEATGAVIEIPDIERDDDEDCFRENG